jgi:hypothetical protein
MKNKITAEEKHYIKLNNKLRQSWNLLKHQEINLNIQIKELNNKIYELKCNNAELLEENEMLKQNMNITPEEIERLVKSVKAMKSMEMIFNMFGGNKDG